MVAFSCFKITIEIECSKMNFFSISHNIVLETEVNADSEATTEEEEELRATAVDLEATTEKEELMVTSVD